MKRSTLLAVGLVAIIGLASGPTALGLSSFTVDRQATIDVVSDDSAVIGLNPGQSDAVTLNDGALSIDPTGTASGINQGSTINLGDYSDPAATPAFTLTNSYDSALTIELSVSVNSDSQANTDNVKFKVFNPDTSTTTTVAEGGTVSLSDVPAGTSLSIAIQIDATSSTSDDLSGTVSVSAS